MLEKIWDIFSMLALFAGGIVSGIIAEKIRRRNLYKNEFASAVSSEKQILNSKPANLGGAFSITEWHLDSFCKLTPFAENVKVLDKRRWKKIKGSWENYRPPEKYYSGSLPELKNKLQHGIDRESLIKKLTDLLQVIEKA